MWALGVVAYIMMCGFNPFDPTAISSDAEILSNIVAGIWMNDHMSQPLV